MIDYKTSYALSLLLHAAVIGVLGWRMSDGDNSTATQTQNAFSVQLLAAASQESEVSPASERSLPEFVEAVVVPPAPTAPVERVAEAEPEPVVEIALERAEPVDTPREDISVVRIIAKASQPDRYPKQNARSARQNIRSSQNNFAEQDNYPATRVVATTLQTNFLDYGKPITASRNAEQASLSKQMQREGARAVRLVKPVYPTIARRLGYEGTVVLTIRVLDSGRVGDVTIVTSTGHRSLDRAAVRAARRSRYAPASFGGLRVNSTKRTAFTFRLEDVD